MMPNIQAYNFTHNHTHAHTNSLTHKLAHPTELICPFAITFTETRLHSHPLGRTVDAAYRGGWGGGGGAEWVA